MFLLLMKTRLQSARNIAQDSFRRHPLGTGVLCLSGMGVFGAVFAIFLALFGLADRMNLLPQTAYQVFYLLLLFLFAGAVPFIASTLLHSNEYSLLFCSPVRPRSIIAAKIIDATVTSSLQFTALGIPAMLACGVALRLPFAGWLLMPFVILLFTLLPSLTTAAGLLLLLGALGMKRIRAAITALNAVMALAVCIIFIVEIQHMPLRTGMMHGMAPDLAILRHQSHISPLVRHMPSGWFVTLLLSLITPDRFPAGAFLKNLSLIVGANAFLFALCLFLGERLISAASVAEENEGGGGAKSHALGTAEIWYRFLSPPCIALLRKDMRYLFRDSVLLSQLAMPSLLFLIPFTLLWSGLEGASLKREEIFPFSCGMTGIILFMQTSIISLSSIGLEGRGFWQYLISPNTGRQLVWSKFLLSTLLSGGSGAFLIGLSALICGMRLPWLVLSPLLTFVCAAGLCGLGVGISATFPRFIYENPAHRVSVWALILGFFASVGYLMAISFLFGAAWMIADMVAPQFVPLAWGFAGLFHLALTGYLILLSLTIGAKRIERYPWEH